jgi:hypothetical protein
MRLRGNASVVLVTAVLMLGTAACGKDDDNPKAEPTDPAISASPTPTAPAWQKKYTQKQIEGYEAALARWETYESRAEPIWEAGRVTDRAEPFFKQYFPSPAWQLELERLKLHEANDVKVSGTPTVYWSRPRLITRDGLNVEIEQCVDFSDVATTQGGAQVKGNKWTTTPHLRGLSLSKPKGYDWLIYSYGDSEGKKQRCTP